jgi:predicted nucleic acid-binding protein
MGWIEELRGKIVGMDTAPLICFIEENPAYVEIVDPFFEAVERNEFSVVTSIVTLLEVLVHPLRAGDSKLAQRYRDLLFHSKGLATISLTQEIAEEAARLRGIRKIRTPDAIQMATAINANASFFLTNDMSLPSLSNLKMLQLDELKTRQ